MRIIPVKTQTANAETGEVTAESMTPFMLMPPPKGKCQICAVAHEPEYPHHGQSPYYAMAFKAATGREMTWADAAAHCDDKVREALKSVLADKGIAWTEPPEGIKPIAHFGDGE